MEFALMDPEKKKPLIFPVTPNSLNVTIDTKTISYSTVNLGDREIPRGMNPINIQFGGILPQGDIGVPRASNLNADSIMKQLMSWQGKDRKMLRLIISKTPWNLDVFIDSFKPDYEGPLINYTISFTQYKPMLVKTSKGKPIKRMNPPKTGSSGRIYVVKKDDNLWDIAKKYKRKGIEWKDMWALNKAKSKSKNPHLIYPGEKFIIPSGW